MSFDIQESTTSDLEAMLAEIQYEIQRRSDAEDRKRSAGLVGKCFKFSDTRSDGCSFLVYTKVLKVDEWGCTLGIQFQNDGEGILSLETHDLSILSLDVEISQEEWDNAFDGFVANVRSMVSGSHK